MKRPETCTFNSKKTYEYFGACHSSSKSAVSQTAGSQNNCQIRAESWHHIVPYMPYKQALDSQNTVV